MSAIERSNECKSKKIFFINSFYPPPFALFNATTAYLSFVSTAIIPNRRSKGRDLYVVYIQTSYCSSPKYIEKSVAFCLFIPENWHKWQKSGMYSMCWSCSMRISMAATRNKPSRRDPSLIVHIPYLLLANKNQKCDKKVSKPWCEC